ncbi:hypothetical protein [Vulcanisaeta souniana]|uniref:hypothetical protein n=1 Tax=Vulcanisaeta souniana TaxID=164452 RepID=UPI000ABC3A7D|nr:hypothetical protein [Vulcanisaeta souniana]
MVDLVVSNILPYPRSLYLLRFSISGNFITVKSLVNGFGVPGPWHSCIMPPCIGWRFVLPIVSIQ